jgi:hypothetical protein
MSDTNQLYEGLGKVTLGTVFASGGAWKNGYSLNPNTFAVTLAGNCRRDVLYSCTFLVVAHALDRDAVFGAGELVHQSIELFVGAKLRIVLGDREQTAERGRLLVGRGDRFFRRFRGQESRPRVGDLLEDAFLVLGVALDGLDQVRNQIVAVAAAGFPPAPIAT